MELKKGYKITDVGIIPEDWVLQEFGEFIFYVKGYPFKSKDYSDNGIRIIRISDTLFDAIKDGNEIYIDENSLSKYKKWQLLENDLIFSTVGSKPPMYDSMVGNVVLVRKRYSGSLLNQNAVLIRAKSKNIFDQFLILYNFKTKRYLRYIEQIFRGNANQASITLNDLFKFTFPIPSNKHEVKNIASALSDADAYITSIEMMIEKKCQIKQGAMQKLLKPKKCWNCISLDKVVWYQEGPGVRNYQFTKNGVKLLNGTNIENGKLFLDKTDRYISEHEAFGFYSHFLADEGDIIIACSGVTINKFDEKVTFVQREHLPLCMNTSTMRFKVINEKIDKHFFFHFLKSDSFKEQIGGKATGSAQLNFGPSHVKNVQISLPNIIEQIEIATILSDINEEIALLENKLSKNKSIKQGMMQNLLTGKIRLV